ncbi:hypothetical protein EJD97_004976 [Solanum chilense]|uniref:Uncharacterized protein n=1 Tax=Solanum chilense TaxID=4083 RepID=A0A6N2ANK5_SOLCI|nr:hypothetical protein EJD97_004976 [Solanum chilense]
MEHSIEIDDQIPLLSQTNQDEIEGGRKVDPLILNIKERIENLYKSRVKPISIFKVNVGLRESNPDAYTPKMVSIGPYHRKNPQLRTMEKYKLLYLQRFLERKKRLDVDSCINELEEKARNCYDGIEYLNIGRREFCEMLLLDGCFVVEFIRERVEIGPRQEDEIIKSDIGCIYNQILRDLMLLENQLPFFVLDKLHSMTKQDDELPLVISNIYFMQYTYFHVMGTPRKHEKTTQRGIRPCQMQLSFLKLELGFQIIKIIILSEAGVRFSNHTNNNSDMTILFDIKFEDGLMTIPCFEVVDETESFLRNLIAYEQQSFEVQPKYFSDFALFMDQLIDSDKDVNLLRKKGIIKHQMGEDKDVSSLFNKIGNGVTMYSTFYYKQVFTNVVKHCYENPWNRRWASLKHNYFSSPWVGASTLTVIILLILTTIQTVLAIVSIIK